MKKFSILFLLFTLYATSLVAQQRMQFSQYMVNQYILNPAAGGTDNNLDLAAGYRKQWTTFSGSPETFYFSGHLPIRAAKKPSKKNANAPFHSAGTFIYSDKAGPLTKTSFLLSYGYNIALFRKYRLAMGLFGGVLNMRLDNSQLKFDQEGEVLTSYNKVLPDASAGFWFYNDKLFAGLSMNQLFYNGVQFYKETGYLVYHYYLTGGYKIPLGYARSSKGAADFYLVPSVLLKYGGWGTAPSLDLNVKLNYTNLFWVGSSYRIGDAAVALAGIKIPAKENGALEIGYAYDYPLSKINAYTTGSHEIILRYTHTLKNSGVVCPERFW
jgi:type IX secretion system PorP/SprF family membrane protein